MARPDSDKYELTLAEGFAELDGIFIGYKKRPGWPFVYANTFSTSRQILLN
jgi:hypothetical protein